MAITVQQINISSPDDGLGDALRTGGSKINSNFLELQAKVIDKEDGVISDLTDVTVVTPTSQQVLVWNGSAWVNAKATLGSIDDITNVDASAPNNGDILQFSEGVWETVPAPSGGSGIPEAPADGFYYGRQDVAWEKVTEEAPSDSKNYIRKNAAWVEQAEHPTGNSGWNWTAGLVSTSPSTGYFSMNNLNYALVTQIKINHKEFNDSKTIDNILKDMGTGYLKIVKPNSGWGLFRVLSHVTDGSGLIEEFTVNFEEGNTTAYERDILHRIYLTPLSAGGGVEEAPEDGTPYVRQDAAWESAPSGGGGSVGGDYGTFECTDDQGAAPTSGGFSVDDNDPLGCTEIGIIFDDKLGINYKKRILTHNRIIIRDSAGLFAQFEVSNVDDVTSWGLLTVSLIDATIQTITLGNDYTISFEPDTVHRHLNLNPSGDAVLKWTGDYVNATSNGTCTGGNLVKVGDYLGNLRMYPNPASVNNTAYDVGMYVEENSVLAGNNAKMLTRGVVYCTGFTACVGSGYVGKPVYVGTNSLPTPVKPSGSGMSIQIIGYMLADYKIFFDPQLSLIKLA